MPVSRFGPPTDTLALDRLIKSANGQLLYQLAHPRRDGATHLLLDPLEPIEKLCALLPPTVSAAPVSRRAGPRAPSFAPKSAPARSSSPSVAVARRPAGGPRRPGATRRPAALMRRVFAIDVLLCSQLCRPPPGERLHLWAEAARCPGPRRRPSHTRPSRRDRLDNRDSVPSVWVRGPPGRLTSRLRQRSIAAQAGRGGNEVKVGARHARECPRTPILSTCGPSRRA
jgi:hypothetical protein